MGSLRLDSPTLRRTDTPPGHPVRREVEDRSVVPESPTTIRFARASLGLAERAPVSATDHRLRPSPKSSPPYCPVARHRSARIQRALADAHRVRSESTSSRFDESSAWDSPNAFRVFPRSSSCVVRMIRVLKLHPHCRLSIFSATRSTVCSLRATSDSSAPRDRSCAPACVLDILPGANAVSLPGPRHDSVIVEHVSVVDVRQPDRVRASALTHTVRRRSPSRLALAT